jgi:hypothetical protein
MNRLPPTIMAHAMRAILFGGVWPKDRGTKAVCRAHDREIDLSRGRTASD